MDFSPLRHHNLAGHTLKVLGLTMQGFGETDACDVARNEDSFKGVPGCDATYTRYATGRFDGRATFYIMSSSPISAALAAVIVADEASANGVGVGPIFLRNRNGTLVIEAETAWIVRPPDVSIGAAPKVRNWVFETNNLRVFAGS